MTRRKRKTRLTKIEEKRSLKQAGLFVFLTIAAVFLLFFLGIPVLIKMAVFLGDLRSTNQIVEKEDQIAPNSPVLQSLPEATNSAELFLQGLSEPDSKVFLYINENQVADVKTNSDGAFSFQTINLEDGVNKIKAQAEDQSGNKSDFSRSVTINFDTESPKLKISSPQNEQEFFEDENEVVIEGETDKSNTVWINDNLAIVDPQGNFSFKTNLQEGENQFKIKVEDPAGNISEKEIKVKYTP